MELKFRTKLHLGFGTLGIMLLLLAAAGLILLNHVKSNVERVVEEKYVGVKVLYSIHDDLDNIMTRSAQLLRVKNEAEKIEVLERIASDKEHIAKSWEHLNDLSNVPDELEIRRSIETAYASYSTMLRDMVSWINQDELDRAVSLFYTEMEPKRAELRQLLSVYSDQYEFDIGKSLDSMKNIYRVGILLLSIFAALIVTLGIGISLIVFRNVTSGLKRVSDVMSVASLDNTGAMPRIYIPVKDEIGEIAEAYNLMAAKVERHTQDVKRFQDVLELQNWNKSRMVEISALLQGKNNMEEVGRIFLQETAPLLGAGYAVLYAEEEQEKSVLVKLASYAGRGEGISRERIAFGEGLVGQCAIENRIFQFEGGPGNYVRIRSGLGSALPTQLLLVPVSTEGHVIGVLEYASFRTFQPERVQLLEELASILGSALNSAQTYKRIQSLLQESQLYAEELQSQSEELQLQQEKLKLLNEKLEEQYKEADEKNKGLEMIRKELEEKNRQVMLSSQYKSEFLANVSHELRTPLNSLILLAQLLVENKEGNLQPKQLEYIKTILGSGVDLLHLISEILDLSKIESGKMDIVFDTVLLRDLGEFVEKQFVPAASQKGLDLEINIEAMAEMEIFTDIQKLQQILRNLLANAIKFTEQGKVTLTLREEYTGGRRSTLVMVVEDTGIGIPEDKLGMIFEAFRQADGTTSRKYGGTGLGLSICKELAALLGGSIEVASEEGRGSIFTVRIPLYPDIPLDMGQLPNHVETAAAADELFVPEEELPDKLQPFTPLSDRIEDTEDLAGKTILIVDDDMRNIFALTGLLESLGAKVLFAEDGCEGIAKLDANPSTDIILMDIMMPKMDGYETIQAIRSSQAPYRNLPIIALTAKAMKYDKERCIQAGADDYISKPIRFEQLLSLLRVWLHASDRGSRRLRPTGSKNDEALQKTEIYLLLEGMYRHYGYDFRNYAASFLRRRILHRMRAERLPTVSALQSKVLHEHTVMERLIDDLSIHVTEMFRDPSFYAAWREQVVPLLRKFPFIRIWHAGCSTGEEVYSMAILLHEEGLYSRSRIYATDMSASVLRKAASGRFPLKHMQKFTKNYLQSGGKRAFSEYYSVTGDEAAFHSFLGENLVFSQHNLITDHSFNEFHAIVCRNVLIYFNDVAKNRALELFNDSLVRGGVLGLGRKEHLYAAIQGEIFEAIEPDEKLYRKMNPRGSRRS